jgi:hypothetical protein
METQKSGSMSLAGSMLIWNAKALHQTKKTALNKNQNTLKTKKMKKQNYTAIFLVNKGGLEVFKKINQVSGWWTENIEGSSGKLNDVFTVHFAETFVRFKVTEFIPQKKVVWFVTDCYLHWLKDKKEWKGTQIVFEISEQKDAAQVNFTHIGLSPEVECYNDCVKGWDQYFKVSLFSLISQGKGQPEIKKMETAGAIA